MPPTCRPSCVEIFSECKFKGETLKICADDPDIESKTWTYRVKSIKIPEKTKVVLYTEKNYEGSKVLVDKSNECMDLYFELLQISGPGFKISFNRNGVDMIKKPKLVRRAKMNLG